MATFATVWAIKSPIRMSEGDTIEVALKRGGSKIVKLGAYLYERDGMFFYASPPKSED